ncbi:Uncharacterised protein [uncultured archaeon]|nr:Uncharacterised protein [uncultured archaeon]
MEKNGQRIIQIIALVFTITMGMLVLLGAMVMMFGNFELGVILFILGLVLVISNESILPRLKHVKSSANPNIEPGLLEEVLNLAIIGYTPPLILGAYLFVTNQSDFKLIIFMAASFTVVTMKIFAKIMASKYMYRPLGGEEVYQFQSQAQPEEYNEPGV